MATLEEAKKCPKCHEPGQEISARQLDRIKGKLLTFMCMTESCKWFKTTYVVQVKPDGTVPEPDTRPRSSKVYVPTEEEIAAINRNAQLAHDQSLQGGEIQR